jgi:hypothetical protein
MNRVFGVYGPQPGQRASSACSLSRRATVVGLKSNSLAILRIEAPPAAYFRAWPSSGDHALCVAVHLPGHVLWHVAARDRFSRSTRTRSWEDEFSRGLTPRQTASTVKRSQEGRFDRQGKASVYRTHAPASRRCCRKVLNGGMKLSWTATVPFAFKTGGKLFLRSRALTHCFGYQCRVVAS